MPNALAYTVVHYDDFKYNAVSDALLAHDFTNAGTASFSGYRNCIAVYSSSTDHYLYCVRGLVDNNRTAYQKLNLLLPTQFLSRNFSYNGGSINFSIRVRVRGISTVAGYDASSAINFGTPGSLSSDFCVNRSNNKNYIRLDSGAPQTSLTEQTNYEWITIQTDYYTRDAGGGDYEIYLRNQTAAGSYNTSVGTGYYATESSTYTFLNSALNLSESMYLASDNMPYMLDYIIIVAYNVNETPISITDNISDVYSLAANSMPQYSAYSVDKSGAVTTTVDYSVNNCT